MTVRSIIQRGQPSLRQPSELVTKFDSPKLHALIKDLWDTQASFNGAGIAAPQIGHNYQVMVLGGETPRYPQSKGVPKVLMINPEYKPINDEQDLGWEGCLSIPGIRGNVPRFTHIQYEAYNELGKKINGQADGFFARVIQHEVDHLQGRLFIDHAVSLLTEDEFQQLRIPAVTNEGFESVADMVRT